MKLRTKFLLPVGSVVLVGILLISLITVTLSRNALQEMADNTVNQVASTLDRTLTTYAQRVLHEIDLLSMEAGQVGADEMELFLSRSIDKLGYGETLSLAGMDGIIRASSDSDGRGMSIADRGYFRQSSRGDTLLSEVIVSRFSGVPVFVASAPVLNGGTVSGVLLFTLPVASFSDEHISPVVVGTEGYAYMTDSKGLAIAHPGKEQLMKLNVAQYDWGQEILARKSGQIGYTFQGIKKQVAFRTNGETGWVLAVTANDDDIYAAVKRIEGLSIILTVSVIAVVLIILLLVVRSVLKGVQETVAVSLDVVDGRLDTAISHRLLQEEDEIGEMSRALQGMLDAFREKAGVIAAIADGNLDQNPGLLSEDDTLGHSLITMVNSLNELLGQVTASVHQVKAGAAQVSAASVSLSQGVTEQAGTMEEVSSALTEISSQFEMSASNVGEARRLASESERIVSDGASLMSQLMESMQGIEEASENTRKIVKVIDDMSFQINLLSLNANVEAARAGKYGRGFSVVADEVRNLALKSSDAVSEITGMVEDVLSRIKQGVSLTERSSREFDEINAGTGRIASVLEELNSTIQEQVDALKQVDVSMEQIEEVTQSSSATAEESAAAAEELEGQANMLNEQVSRFRLRNGHARLALPYSRN